MTSTGEKYAYLTKKNAVRLLVIGGIFGPIYLIMHYACKGNIYLSFFLKMQLVFLIFFIFYFMYLPNLFAYLEVGCTTDIMVERKREVMERV